MAISCVDARDEEILTAEARQGRPCGAYLFSGADTGAQKLAAASFLGELLGGAGGAEFAQSRVSGGLHADVMTVDKGVSSIGIDDVRAVSSFIATAPREGPFKSAVFFEAQNLTESAQNAFLKTLEEPADGVVLILCARGTDSLLPTLLSRVRRVRLVGGDAPEQEPDETAMRLEAILLEGDVWAALMAAEAASKSAESASSALEALHTAFEGAVLRGGDPGLGSVPVSRSFARRADSLIIRAMSDINSNVSPRLVMEVLMVRLQEEYNAENGGGPL